MADNGENTVEDSTTDGFTPDGSTTDSSTPEFRESNYHQNMEALQSMAESLLELRHILETMQIDITKEGVPMVGHDVLIERALSVIETSKTTADLAMERLPTELTQQHVHTQQCLITRQNRASEAFHIPEIAEKIFSHLVIEDLLHVEKVDRKIFAIIQGSPVLQTNLFLKPRQTGPFAMLCSTDTARIARLWALKPRQSPLFCRVKALVEDHAADTTSEIRPTTHTGNMFLMLRSDDRLTTEARGARVSSMLVCQPPVRVMKVTMFCCPQGKLAPNIPLDRDGHFVLKAEHGITMGHIVETIKTMRELHYPCWANMRDRVVKKNRKKNRSESRAYELNPEARAYARWPEFRTVVTLEQDDPILLGWKGRVQRPLSGTPRHFGYVRWYVYTGHHDFDQEDTDNFR
jgi:hypothetical protein